jgi:hypothetical protein
VTFQGTTVGVRGSPIVAFFSSRGPSHDYRYLLKPDLIAPGLNVLLAEADSGGFLFGSGTSFAAPHVSGLAALLKVAHPEWTPAAIRSAMVTTATIYDSNGDRIKDERRGGPASAYALGAGQVNATAAVNPGLVYDMGATDYGAFVCQLFRSSDDGDVQEIIRNLALNCSTLPPMEDYMLNYPSIVVPPNTTVHRTLTKVGADRDVYAGSVTVDDPARVRVHLSPDTLTFDGGDGQEQSFTVSAELDSGADTTEGFLVWRSKTVADRTVRSPIVIIGI